MALFGLWLFRHADDRVLRFGRPRCAGRRVCGTCTVATAEGCRLRRTALLVAGFVALAALVPLFGSTAELHADIARYALPFPGLNALYDRAIEPWLAANVDTFTPSGEAFTMTRTELLVELRVEPLLAFAVAAWAALGFFRGDLSGGARRLAFAGGALGYVYLELIAYRGTGEPLLGSLVHECAELWFLLFTMELLRRTFAPAPSASSATFAARA
jgi:hypothetical protein